MSSAEKVSYIQLHIYKAGGWICGAEKSSSCMSFIRLLNSNNLFIGRAGKLTLVAGLCIYCTHTNYGNQRDTGRISCSYLSFLNYKFINWCWKSRSTSRCLGVIRQLFYSDTTPFLNTSFCCGLGNSPSAVL